MISSPLNLIPNSIPPKTVTHINIDLISNPSHVALGEQRSIAFTARDFEARFEYLI